ncbi:hypothetical protein [Paenibacillus radicis (ex Xue et al. 2023)]|uniref:Phospholipase C/D domain-containing protein n=1 Tax=Paenibacillus radicis (ex Xue et al. 2023) TaxID=2972489 RepID=A0ABT1YIS1_9BACL|nr:hypothetical protein [Paenibacillus radicis (ex Xue et al. 2023)]MCR8633068.1 hypothetical protein [Paenibacillus radicis (ex Xue et al. 2023)]
MSENITHFSSMEDCFNFMEVSPDICSEFKKAGQMNYNLARLASVTRYGDKFTAPLMGELREAYRSGKFDEAQQRKLTYVLGWLCHRAADRCMKPVFSSFDASTLRHAENIDYSPSECSVYNDAFIYHLYYAKEENGLYPKTVFEDQMDSGPENERFDVLGTRELNRMIIQNSLLPMHHPGAVNGDTDAWFDFIERKRQRFTLEVERYRDAILNPVLAKVDRYITDAEFYDKEEPLLKLAVSLRAKDSGSRDYDVRSALAAEPHSSYAHILHTGFRYLASASEFFVGDMSVEELKDRFDIGKLGRDGQPA